MTPRLRRSFIALLAAGMAAGMASHAQAQAPSGYPNRPIRMIIPFAPGGGVDNIARAVSTKMGERLGGFTVVIDNRPSASGIVGEAAVAQAAPDGYTVLFDSFAFAVNASLRKLAFDPAKDLIPVARTATAPMIFAVHPSIPARTVPEFVAWARKQQGSATFASFGVGSSAHLAGELLADREKVPLLHVPYKGGAPALTDLVGGQVSSYFANASSGLQFVKSGQVRALAVSSKTRLRTLPDVPTMQEAGIADFEVLDWTGMFVPRGTPPAIIDKLQDAMLFALNDPAVAQRLRDIGVDPAPLPQPAFKGFVLEQMQTWSSLIREKKISME